MTGVTFVIERPVEHGRYIGPEVYTFECDSPVKFARLMNDMIRDMPWDARFVKIITN